MDIRGAFEAFEVVNGKLGASRPHPTNLYFVQQAAQQGRLFPMQKLIEVTSLSDLFEGKYESEESCVAYGQAWAVVYFLLESASRGERGKFVEFMRRDVRGGLRRNSNASSGPTWQDSRAG